MNVVAVNVQLKNSYLQTFVQLFLHYLTINANFFKVLKLCKNLNKYAKNKYIKKIIMYNSNILLKLYKLVLKIYKYIYLYTFEN